jgi:small GTP-binding protein
LSGRADPPESSQNRPEKSWTEPFRDRWASIPPARQRDLNRVLGLLPSSLKRWRGLLEAGVTHVRQTAGDRRRVAIVGPPNAGKSTLYNRLILDGQAKAAVGPRPGTTRVAQEGDVGLFSVVDTPGAGPELHEARENAFAAARQADVLIVLFDATAPLDDSDRGLLDDLRALGKPWVAVLNKMDAVRSDRPRVHGRAAQALGLTTEDLLTASARSGTGLERILMAVAEREPEIVAARARGARAPAASTAAAIALTPLPMIDFIPLIAVQTALVLSLARIYGYRITPARARELIATFGIGWMARTIFYELIKLGGPPGWLVSAAVAAGTTTALGYGAAAWFDHGEQFSRERLKGISETVGPRLVGRWSGRRKPRRRDMEREVELLIEENPGPEKEAGDGPGEGRESARDV